MASVDPTPASTPQQELAWLRTLLDFDAKHSWLGVDDLDDQGRCLALAYALRALGARHVRDLADNYYLKTDPADRVPAASRWVYGFEVDMGSGPVFVGIHGEESRRAAELSAAQRADAAGPDRVVSRPVWDGKGSAFPTLEQARPFYSLATFATLLRLSEQGAAHIRARMLEETLVGCPAPGKPGPRL